VPSAIRDRFDSFGRQTVLNVTIRGAHTPGQGLVSGDSAHFRRRDAWHANCTV